MRTARQSALQASTLLLQSALLLLATLSCSAPPKRSPPHDPGPQPNVVIIVSDDAGYGDFGCYGGTEIPTPAIDALAQRGVRFTQAYVTASVCCPSRAGILTGRYQQRFGHEFNGPGQPEPGYTQQDMGLAVEQRTVGDALGALGYRTACVGKWHMGVQPQFHPQRRGFDHFYGILGGSRSYMPKEALSTQATLQNNGAAVAESSFEYLTDAFTDAALDFVSQEDDRPFLLYLAYTAPHTPMQAKDSDLATFAGIQDDRRRRYAAMLKAFDDGVGALRERLRERGTLANTLILFINDNGGATNNGSDNGALRGMKGSKWEGGLRVPMIASWPAGRFVQGASFVHPVSALDILPTALAAAQGLAKSGAHDGVNLLPYVRGNRIDTPHETLFWRRGIATAVRHGDWKLIRSEGNPDLCFDLASDPGETMNLAPARPDRVATLRGLLESWESQLAAPRWKEGARWEQNQRAKHRMEVVGREMERRYP